MTLPQLRSEIWLKCRKSVTNVQVAADKLNISLPLTNEKDAERLLQSLSKKRAKPKREIPSWVIARYNQAHHEWFLQNLPLTHKDGHYLAPVFPDVGTSNGLTRMIVDYLKWAGHFANRTGNEGRVIPDKKNPGQAIRIKSSSKNGMQDIDVNLKHPAHIFGIPWKIEIKVGGDTHKDHQKNFGAIVQQTGGVYSVARDAEDFFNQLDKLLS